MKKIRLKRSPFDELMWVVLEMGHQGKNTAPHWPHDHRLRPRLKNAALKGCGYG